MAIVLVSLIVPWLVYACILGVMQTLMGILAIRERKTAVIPLPLRGMPTIKVRGPWGLVIVVPALSLFIFGAVNMSRVAFLEIRASENPVAATAALLASAAALALLRRYRAAAARSRLE